MRLLILLLCVFFIGCSLYVEDLKSVYKERDGIYKSSEKQESMNDDIFYSSFFDSKKSYIENISSKEDFVSLKKDTMYKQYLEANYYGYDIEKPKQETNNDSIKLSYQRDKIYHIESEKEYQRNIETRYEYMDFSVHDFQNDFYYSSQDYRIIGNNNYFGNRVYFRNNSNNKKKIKTQNNQNNSYERERNSYENFRQREPNNNNIRNENEYNRRATNRRRR